MLAAPALAETGFGLLGASADGDAGDADSLLFGCAFAALEAAKVAFAGVFVSEIAFAALGCCGCCCCCGGGVRLATFAMG
jgi:hypothetical protein